jgi:maleylpyruvate isomerase
LIADLARSCRALEVSFDALDDDKWDFEVTVRAGSRTMAEIVFSRLREVEVHHLDLAVGYQPADWPRIYVDGELSRQLSGLPERADHVQLVTWLIGRADTPHLEHW